MHCNGCQEPKQFGMFGDAGYGGKWYCMETTGGFCNMKGGEENRNHIARFSSSFLFLREGLLTSFAFSFWSCGFRHILSDFLRVVFFSQSPPTTQHQECWRSYMTFKIKQADKVRDEYKKKLAVLKTEGHAGESRASGSKDDDGGPIPLPPLKVRRTAEELKVHEVVFKAGTPCPRCAWPGEWDWFVPSEDMPPTLPFGATSPEEPKDEEGMTVVEQVTYQGFAAPDTPSSEEGGQQLINEQMHP